MPLQQADFFFRDFFWQRLVRRRHGLDRDITPSEQVDLQP